jgi:Ca-activated chloride channel family protein
MKVKTLGALGALGMLLTSVTVWSVTNPRPADQENGKTDSVVDPEDPRPTVPAFAGASFSTGKTLMMEGRLGHSKLLSTKDNETMLLVNVTADKGTVSNTSAPLNLAIVVDRSGSMKGRRLQQALDAARGMVRRLRDRDVVSVVTYSTTTQIVSPPTQVDSFTRDRVIAAIDTITAEGDTCISCGIDAGMEQLRQRSGAGMIDRLLLLSDGEATAGVRDVEGFRSIGSRVRNMGASISSVGVDVQYNERVMNALAIESNGRHYFAESASSLVRVFDEELESLVKSVAKSSEVAIDLAPGVEVQKVFDRTFRREGNKLFVPLGTFSSGEEKTVFVSLRVPRGAAGERPIADVKMTYDDVTGAIGRGECEGKLAALLTEEEKNVTTEVDPFVQARFLRSETKTALNDANDLFASGRADEARRRLNEGLANVRKQRELALSRAAPAAKPKLAADLGKQEQALDEANTGFSAPPAQAGAPAEREQSAQKRKNSVNALEQGF